jgi:oligopeptide/dipeptide ABC transporter ATP-binding protein
MIPELIRSENLCKTYISNNLFRSARSRSFTALRHASLGIRKGEVMGLVGESGCGKSTFGKVLLKLAEPDSGKIFLEGVDITKFSKREMRPIRRRLQVIFQDPYSSLSPQMNIRDIIAEPLEIHGIGNASIRTERAAELLETVGLGAECLCKYPHEFSGGQRQRIGIARALALNPDFILADEAVSALDVSLQAQVVNLLADMRRRFSLTMLFITHDLSLAQHLCDHIAVMYLGTIVENGPADEVCRSPLHPYTRILLSAVPSPDPRRKKERQFMKGDLSDVRALSGEGCIFRKRCPMEKKECSESSPEMKESALPGHMVACLNYE